MVNLNVKKLTSSLTISYRILEWLGTSVCSASEPCSKDLNCLQFKPLARIKCASFTTA